MSVRGVLASTNVDDSKLCQEREVYDAMGNKSQDIREWWCSVCDVLIFRGKIGVAADNFTGGDSTQWQTHAWGDQHRKMKDRSKQILDEQARKRQLESGDEEEGDTKRVKATCERCTTMVSAVKAGHFTCFDILKENESGNLRNLQKGAVEAMKKESLPFIVALHAMNSEVLNVVDVIGNSLLHIAILKSNADIISWLLKVDEKLLDVANRKGKKPADIPMNKNIEEILKAKGADLEGWVIKKRPTGIFKNN